MIIFFVLFLSKKAGEDTVIGPLQVSYGSCGMEVQEVREDGGGVG